VLTRKDDKFKILLTIELFAEALKIEVKSMFHAYKQIENSKLIILSDKKVIFEIFEELKWLNIKKNAN